jgi:hypothetical protein
MTDFRDATIVCPDCEGRFQDWIPRDEPARVCVYCGAHVAHDRLVEIDGLWRVVPELRQVA